MVIGMRYLAKKNYRHTGYLGEKLTGYGTFKQEILGKSTIKFRDTNHPNGDTGYSGQKLLMVYSMLKSPLPRPNGASLVINVTGYSLTSKRIPYLLREGL